MFVLLMRKYKNERVARELEVRKISMKEKGMGCLMVEQKVGGEDVVFGEGGNQSVKDVWVVVMSQPIVSDPSHAVVVRPVRNRILMYILVSEDRSWAKSRIMATVVTGESMLSIQRVEDAAFHHVVVTPIGGQSISSLK